MKSLLVVGLVATGCYQAYGPGPAYGTMTPEPVTVSGPPGGAMDPGTEYQAPQNPDMPGYPAGYPQGGYPQGSEYGQGSADQGAPQPDPSGDPQNANNVMGTVTDSEIDSTLQPYGEWVSDDEYGRVWRPYATTVGVNFTPYETCGSWVYTDFGWTYQACEEWSWGWLPFHYGQWDWIDSSWCWVPDYTWSPGWVDWRYGNDTVGWRPTRPHRGSILRDHRDGRGGDALVRDHRRGVRDSDWRFVHTTDLNKHNLASRTIANAEGLRSTSEVARPPATGVRPTRTAASLMSNRLAGRVATTPTRGNPYSSTRPSNRVYPQRGQNLYDPSRGYQPQYQNRGSYQQPNRGNTGAYQPNRGYYNDGTYHQSRGYQPVQPNRGYQGTSQPNRTQPSRGYQPNTTYQPNRTYNPSGRPNTTYQPSRGSTQPSRTYSPSRSSGSYSRPSSSSSSSRSSGSYSRPSSSSSSSRSSSGSSSRSSSSSSHSSSSSSHSGGGRHK